ncbi:MAG: hypothetical protein FWD66_06005 [Paludibacter sp.]|nr:hypothetical protein [Paludibacter sp.]
MKTLKFIFRRINAFLCDLALAYGLFYLLMFIRPVGFPIGAYFSCSVILYFGLTFGLFGRSFMQFLFGIEIEKRTLNHLLFKLFFISVIPLVLSILHFDILLVMYVLLILILSIILLPFTKKSLWQWCSGAQMKLQKNMFTSKLQVIILSGVTIVLIIIPILRSNFRFNIDDFYQNNKTEAYPISIFEKNYYIKNIQLYKQDPLNYIMQLFDKYDIVVLCERLHEETTQWDFFSEVVLNDAFAGKVQNVFTEIGNAQEQERLDMYMNTHFDTEEDLQRITAYIARECTTWPIWPNTNFYDFILNLHKFNEIRNKDNRINLFFTDSTIVWNKAKNQQEYDGIIENSNRDSIMAYQLINQYDKLATKKCLLITNTRHAWNIGKNEASYIFKKFPEKTAVVLISGTTQLISPPMNGTLDAAAVEIQDSIWAIDFHKCPLGNIDWDLFPRRYKTHNLKYKDIFAGMVYCKTPQKWILSNNYPFILDNFQDTLLKRSALVGDKFLNTIKNSIAREYFNTIDVRKSPVFALVNLVFLSVHSIILLYLFLNLSVKLLSMLFRKQRVESAVND